MLRQSSAIDFTSSKHKAHVKHMSHSGLTPNPVTSTNIGSPVPSTQIPHHLIIPQPSDGWSSMKGLRLCGIVILRMTLVKPAAQYQGCSAVALACAGASAFACAGAFSYAYAGAGAQGPIPLPT
ncbi:hypothetical protein O181_103864 [Austropuccinia psidii MF-1]|uniref:Uncharacterized protein n=1 Tax=Austropuccinia psidii MF-1 TaxID=1389203 RepID=A0A9Q3JLA7_9BASI|nr:hypothetical protein [Austropuccinia psidii MF-1]